MAHREVKGGAGFQVNESEMDWNTGRGSHDKFQPRIKSLSRKANGQDLACNLVELMPGYVLPPALPSQLKFTQDISLAGPALIFAPDENSWFARSDIL